MGNGGASGYVLQSDANGNGTWEPADSVVRAGNGLSYSGTALNSVWTQSGNNIYNNTSGDVGIGISSPNYPLEIWREYNVSAALYSPFANAELYLAAGSISESALRLGVSNGGNSSILDRWVFSKDANEENGNNTGSDFFLARYNDAGVSLGEPIGITRASGTVVFGISGVSTTANTIQINGSIAAAVTTTSASDTLNGTNYCVIYTGGSGNTFTLPTASSVTGRIYRLVNQGTATLTTSTYTTGNGTTATTLAVNTSIEVISDGTVWRKIN